MFSGRATDTALTFDCGDSRPGDGRPPRTEARGDSGVRARTGLGKRARDSCPIRTRPRRALRRRPDDGPTSPGRVGGRGSAPALPRPRDVRGTAPSAAEPDRELHRGHGRPRHRRREPHPGRRAGQGACGRCARPRSRPSRAGAALAPPAARRRQPGLPLRRLPERHRSCPDCSTVPTCPTACTTSSPRAGRRPTWAEDSLSAGVATPDEAALLECEEGAVVIRAHPPRALGGPADRDLPQRLPRRPAHRLVPARRLIRPCDPSARPQPAESGNDYAGLVAHPRRVRTAEVRLDVECVQGRVGAPLAQRPEPGRGRRARARRRARPARPGRSARRRSA